jgi:hypothetical protein
MLIRGRFSARFGPTQPNLRVSHRTLSLLTMVLLTVALFPSAAVAQEALQFNVPYHCPDGTDKVITQCKPWGKGEVCYWRNEKNGQVINEQYNVRPQMDGWLRECKVKAASTPAATSATSAAKQASTQPPPSTLTPTPTGRVAAGLNPAYLNDMPSADTVKKLIQGSDPTDTMERQVAVFNLLKARIQRHVVTDRSRYGNTPDEDKVTYAYSLAAYEIEEGYKKTHTKEEANAFFSRHGQYESTWDMEKEIDTKLLSAAAVAESRANDRSMFQQRQAHNDAIVRQNQEAEARAAAAAQAGPGRPSTDPTSVAIQRCLELGGDGLSCVGKGLGKGLAGMVGLDLDAIGAPGRTGLMIAGNYRDPSGAWLGFSESSASLSNCGKLIPVALHYSITKRGTSLVLQVTNEPRPFTLVLGPDGNMTGPGTIDVKGQVVVGYRRYTVYTRRVSDNQIVGQHEESEPIYGPKVDRCTLASLRSGGPVPAASLSNLLTATLALAGGDKSGGNVKTYPPGPRLVGSYEGSGGLKIAFAPEAAILDCREAHIASTYIVRNAADALRVTIDNGGTPITLALQADGSLAGSGTTDITGRLVSGQASEGGVTYRPVRANCPVGTLSPRTQKSSTSAGM